MRGGRLVAVLEPLLGRPWAAQAAGGGPEAALLQATLRRYWDAQRWRLLGQARAQSGAVTE